MRHAASKRRDPPETQHPERAGSLLAHLSATYHCEYMQMVRRYAFRCFAFVITIFSFFVLTGCDKKLRVSAAPPPPAVTVAKPLEQDVIEWDTYNGYLEAVESVNVSARVSGMITSAPFTEGSLVKKSQVLFVLDERPFKADLDLKLADHERAKSQLAIALLTYQRLEAAHKQNAASQQDFDFNCHKADGLYAKADATVAGAKASVEIARLNLEWCQVTSPIDGRVSRKMVTVGNMVTGGVSVPTLLTTIQSVGPIYCNFDVDERSVLKYQKLSAEKKRLHERDGKVPCFARLGNETEFLHAGYIDFLDNRADATTGTLRARGLLQNTSGLLTPGFYMSLRIPGSGRYKALLVPDNAIGNDQSHRTVLVVNKDNLVEVRPVQIGALFGDMRSITSGLSPNDKVIVNGQMRAFPGTPVTPTEIALQVDPQSYAGPNVATSDESRSIPVVQPMARTTNGKTP